MNWIFQHWINRINNDGIIEWHRPLVSKNHGEKWRRNRISAIAVATTTSAFVLGIFLASFDWNTRSSSRRPAWETRKHPSDSLRSSRYDSGLSLSPLEPWHKRRRCRQERERERERETFSSTSMTKSGSANRKRNEITKDKLLAHEKELEKTRHARDRKARGSYVNR